MIRYPGAKTAYTKTILGHIPDTTHTLIEPFCGMGSVTLAAINRGGVKRVWLNDADPGVVALWRSVLDPELLIERVMAYTPKAEDFYTYKKEPVTGNTLEDAFRMVVLHQVSYSGLGKKAGSPIGGARQTGAYKVGCRWSPTRLTKRLRDASSLLSMVDVQVTSVDALTLLGEDGFLYIDPPYIEAGPGLYVHGSPDHTGMAAMLRSRGDWLLSYDDHPAVRELYRWADMGGLDVTSQLRKKKVPELLIQPFKKEN